MEITPRRSAGPLPDAAPHAVRDRVRVGTLIAGIALLTAAGGAAPPGLMTDPKESSAHSSTSDAGPATKASPLSAAAAEATELRRGNDRASRGDRPDPAALPPVDVPSATPSPTPPPAPPSPGIAGIPNPCSIDLPITADMSAAEIAARTEQQWGFRLTGSAWRDDEYRSVVKLFAETLDSVDCTDYLRRVKEGNGGMLEVSSNSKNSWAWGDYGLSRANVLTLDLAKFRQGYADGDRGRLVRLIIHEMAHSLNADRFSEPAYWRSFNRVWASNGPVSAYGSTQTESFAEAVGYYVARCAADNPYTTTEHTAYYNYVKRDIFDGREFGGAAGSPQNCVIKGR